MKFYYIFFYGFMYLKETLAVETYIFEVWDNFYTGSKP